MNPLTSKAPKVKFWGAVIALAFAVMLSVTPAFADSVKLVDVGGANQGGVYVVPYYLSINRGTNIIAMCDDFDHHVYIGESWDANISSFGNLSLTRWNTPYTQQYKQEAWLLSSYFSHPNEAGDINFAAWAIFTPSVMTNAGYTARSDYWLHQAQMQSFAGFDFSGYRIITPLNLGLDGAQEYITQVPVPEPASLTLLGIGMLALVFVIKRG